jgi:hypothetical protein
MAAVDSIIEVMREVVMTPNPALVTREEFLKLEERVDRILLMMDELEERLEPPRENHSEPSGKSTSDDSVEILSRLEESSVVTTPVHFYRPPPPRP